MKKLSRYALVTSLVLSLAACSHYSEELSSLDKEMGTQTASVTPIQNIQPAAGAPAAQGHAAFLNYLARDYYALARYENDQAFDYKSSRVYTNKAAIASQGNFVVPSKLSSYAISSDRTGDLTRSRADLITALKTRNTPENAAGLAKAQTSFDCWIERAEEATDDKHFAQCRGEFEQAMASLVTPAAGSGAGSEYKISFAKESALIEPASQKDVDYVASVLKDPKNAAYSVTLSGGADALSTARIEAVRKALLDKGVSASQIAPVLSPETAATEAAGSVTLTLIAPTAAGDATTTTKFVPIAPVVVPPGQ